MRTRPIVEGTARAALALLGTGLSLFGAAAPEYQARAVRTARPPSIDGRLDDSAWASAEIVGKLVQREPKDGLPATEKTEIRILYDDRNLYFGIMCYDSEPGRIVAKEMRRDGELMNDDYFSIILDTFNDHRNAFAFATNPLGAQRDGLIRDEGASRNPDWDGIWVVKTRQGPDGWSAEIAIPFRTLRFSKDKEQTWGVNFHRFIARKREEDFWTPMPRSYGFFGAYKISNYGHLVGLEGIRQGEKWQVMPYLIGGGSKDDVDQPFKLKGDAGLDLKYRLTSNVMADLTVNTDFAQVESDQEQFNLTRFEIFFPEKREFFLEGGDIFRFGERYQEHEPPSTLLFFSRTIGLSEDGREIPILGGVKVTGKAGKYDIGLMNILTDQTSYTTDEGESVQIERTNSSVFRLKRDIFEKSTFGVMALSKDSFAGGDYNRAAGFDFNLAFGQHFQGAGFLAKTFSPDLRGQDWAGHFNLIYESDFFQNDVSYSDIGENFDAEMGFVPRTDIRKLRWNIGVSPRPGILGIRQCFLFNYLTYIENHAGRLESRNNMTGIFNLFQSGATVFAGFMQNYEYLSEPFEIKDGVFIPVDGYHYNTALFWLESDMSRPVGGRAEIQAGDFYNGTIFSLQSQGKLRISRHFNMEFIYTLDKINLPVAGGRFTTSIAGARIIYSFTPNIYAKAYIQWNSAEERFRSNFLIRWIYKPGANIYFIYNETRKLGAAGFLEDRAVMLKVSFLFNL
jgi:hypothetical protein